ncbi:AAA family ATPase [Aquihabitans sp. G128]|uniref:ATP-dependent nuclease n=1 Tax=Aquihabitans sp. G128 TaxID=2849779 RepID=UPI001C22704B|nr:AAA family ATPase [Aquihabitans sp. G128]QXC61597.1 AAA family ATPase [Aquihabitans sp. G128]
MRIARLVFVNHRVIPDLDFEVRNHLALVGPNASGKSTLLRALDVVLGGTFGQVLTTFTDSEFRDPDEPLRVEVHFDSFDDSDRSAFPDEINVSTVDGVATESLELSCEVSYEDGEPNLVRVFKKPGDDRRVRPEHLAAVGWGFLPATRSPERELGAGRRSALRTLVSSLDLGDQKAQLVDLLAEANALIDGTETVLDLRARLAEGLTDLTPRPVAAEDLSVVVAPVAENPSSQAELRLRDHAGEPAPLHHQSDGLRALSTIVVQRLAQPAAILAIDEPEIHLHPRGQARLGGLLASGTGQRLVATHSSAVLSSFHPADVVALVDDGIRQLPPEAVAAAPAFFAQWWDDAALEPLTAKSVVLVEGPSDRVLLRSVARLLGHDLDRVDSSVVVAGGATSFKTLLRLYGPRGFDLDLFGLVDREEANIVATAFGVSNDDEALLSVGFQVSDPDLEGEAVSGLGVARHAELLCASGLYDERQILGTFKVDSVAEIEADAYTEWCRLKKVVHAVALERTMVLNDAERLASLVSLVALIVDS